MVLMPLILGISCGEQGEVELHHVSPSAAKALMETFPDADVASVEIETEGDMDLYEAELNQAGETFEVKVSPDGAIVAIETELGIDEVPQPVADSIYRELDGGSLIEIEKVEALAMTAGGKITKLEQPRMTYEVEYRKFGIRRELELDAEGMLR